MKLIGLVSLIGGIFLIFFAVVLLSIGPTKFTEIVSSQTPIEPTQLTGLYDFTKQRAVFNNTNLSIPRYLAQSNDTPQVLGEANVAKRIEVDLTNQRLYAYEGDSKIFDFPISSGKWNKTPKGVFKIWIKLRYTLMTGGSKALSTYYYLPNVPYTMFFYNEAYPKTDGYGIHGAYWHNNFGHPMSHGCINMKEEDVAQIFYWANPDLQGRNSILASQSNPGTEVIIYGDAPIE